jgi:hypothetical protein
MDEVPDRPPFMFMIDSYFTVYQGRRLGLLGNYCEPGLAIDFTRLNGVLCGMCQRGPEKYTFHLKKAMPHTSAACGWSIFFETRFNSGA